MLYLQANPGSTPSQVASALITNSTKNKVTSAGTGSPNRLLYMGFIGGGGTNQPPTANFTFSCTARTCTFDGTSSTDDHGIVSYSWTRKTGPPIGNTAVTTFTFADGGSKAITLTVTDAGGLSNSITKTLVLP
jgi:hypothetical protein